MMCDLLLSSLKKTRFVVTVFGHGKKWPAILAVEFGRPLVQQIPCQEKVFNFWTSARINRAKMPDFLFGTVFAEGKKWLKWTKMAEMSQFLEMVRNFDLPKWQSGLKKWLKWANFEKRCVIFFQKMNYFYAPKIINQCQLKGYDLFFCKFSKFNLRTVCRMLAWCNGLRKILNLF